MTSKSMKGGNAPRAAVPKPLTEEEKRFKIMQFLQQKREQFALNILCNLVHVASGRVVARRDSIDLSLDTKGLVNSAVKMADELMEKLYPTGEESDKSNN